MEMQTKKTLVLGASPNPARFSHTCITMLVNQGIPVVAVGLREGNAGGVPVLPGMPAVSGIHTITIYLGARNQPPYYQYIVSLKPQRVIFNPGSENAEFEQLLRNQGISVIHACTLMMLDYGEF